MVKRVLAAAVVLLAFAVTASAQPKVQQAPIKPTPASDAATMFQSYCAVCHGKDAKGGGPAASALAKAPADLTHISTRNGGTYPEIKVKRFIQGLDTISAHGTRDMPMWGDLFRALDQNTAEIRVQALSDYLKGLQLK